MSNTSENNIRLSGIIEESFVDGPGIRFVIFTQGCKKRCVGCHNPETQPLCGGYFKNMDEIINQWDENPLLKGITISGGEPFLQSEKSLYLAKKAKEKGLDVVIYSGYYYDELMKMNDKNIIKLLEACDILVDGPFEIQNKDLSLPFRGSSNQRLIDLNKTNKNKQVVLYEHK